MHDAKAQGEHVQTADEVIDADDRYAGGVDDRHAVHLDASPPDFTHRADAQMPATLEGTFDLRDYGCEQPGAAGDTVCHPHIDQRHTSGERTQDTRRPPDASLTCAHQNACPKPK